MVTIQLDERLLEIASNAAARAQAAQGAVASGWSDRVAQGTADLQLSLGQLCGFVAHVKKAADKAAAVQAPGGQG